MTEEEARQYSQYEEGGNSPYDLYGALSGYGGDCPEGIPVEFGLLSILAAFGAAFGILYMALTIKLGGRRKRQVSGLSDSLTCDAQTGSISGYYGCHLQNFVFGGEDGTYWQQAADLLWHGLEEFEEKVDKIAEGQDTGDSWISQIFNQFAFLNDVDNQLTENDLDGIEPPILDETWGLGIRNSSQLKKIPTNTTVEEPVKLDNEETVSRNKREAPEDADDEYLETEEKCRVDMWRCLSKVVEGGLHYIDNPDGLYGLAKKTMFKVAFHGGFSNMWSGLMTVPEARQIKQCMNSHTECISYEILRREAGASMEVKEDPHVKGEKAHKRERLIINPEFVESLDQGDGARQFDEDYYNNEV